MLSFFKNILLNKDNTNIVLHDVLACDRILEWLIFDMDSITPCCEKPHNGELNISLYDHDNFQSLIGRKLQLIKEINKDKTHVCRTCYRLRKYERICASDFSAKILSFSFDKRCSVRCSYCFMAEPEMRKKITRSKTHRDKVYQTILQILSSIPPDDVHFVGWTGGEPLLLPKFEELYKKIIAFTPEELNIYSNLTYFQPLLLKTLQNTRIQLICSLDSGTPETYFKVKGKDYFHRVIENLKKYSMSPHKIYAKYIFLSENCNKQEIEAFFHILSECNITNAVISSDDFASSPLPQELVNAMIFFCETASKQGIMVTSTVRQNVPEIETIVKKNGSISI